MENCSAQSGVTKCDIAAWIIMSIALILVIKLHLLPSLLSGLLVYELVHILSRQIHVANLSGQRAKLIAIALLATLIVGLITLAGIGIIAFLPCSKNWQTFWIVHGRSSPRNSRPICQPISTQPRAILSIGCAAMREKSRCLARRLGEP